MFISELIEKLQECLKEKGDIEVWLRHTDHTGFDYCVPFDEEDVSIGTNASEHLEATEEETQEWWKMVREKEEIDENFDMDSIPQAGEIECVLIEVRLD